MKVMGRELIKVRGQGAREATGRLFLVGYGTVLMGRELIKVCLGKIK